MDEKITIRTELLDALNNGIADRESAFNEIKKANTEDKRPEVKPDDLVGSEYQAKDKCGEMGSEGDTTIAGCINTLASEIAAFVEGVKGVDEADVSSLLDGEEEVEDEPSGGGGGWTGDPIDDTTTSTSNDGIGTVTITESGVAVSGATGEEVGTIEPGQYKVYETRKDDQGNTIAVRISPDGEEEKWIVLNQNGTTVGSFYETNQVGSFTCTSDQIIVYDANGNAIDTLTQGYHKVYAINTDENGNVKAIRISPDGEEERWIQIYKDGKYIDGGVFEQYGQEFTNPQTYDNGQGTKATVYGKRNKILGGVLGVLVVGLGATIYVKKKKEKEDGTYEEEEEELPVGDYDIYDYNTDDDGNMTSAKISDDDAAEEQWVEF